MSGETWTAYGADGSAEIVPCQHMTDIQQLAAIIQSRIAFMIADHGPDQDQLTVDDHVEARVSGQWYEVTVSWSYRTARKEQTTNDPHLTG